MWLLYLPITQEKKRMIHESLVIDQQQGSLLISTVGYCILGALLTPWLLLPIGFNLLALIDMKRRLKKGF
jgi:hypothetical protein